MVVYGHNDSVHRDFEAFGHSFQNAFVGLMWYDPIHIVRGQTGRFNCLKRRV